MDYILPLVTGVTLSRDDSGILHSRLSLPFLRTRRKSKTDGKVVLEISRSRVSLRRAFALQGSTESARTQALSFPD